MDPMSITTEMMVPGTVADLMEPLNGKLPETATVQEAIDFLRGADNARQITYLYTVDGSNRLTGLVVIRDLLLADPQQPLTSVMLPAPFSLPLSMAANDAVRAAVHRHYRSEEHTSELQSLMRNSYAVFCLKKTNHHTHINHPHLSHPLHK